MTPDYEKTIKKLSNKVSKFTSNSYPIKHYKKTVNDSVFSNIPSLTILYYGIVPVIILIILIASKPRFVLSDIKVDDDIDQKPTLNYTNLFFWLVIITTVVYTCFFGYKYKNNLCISR
jgi:hypothetical protein